MRRLCGYWASIRKCKCLAVVGVLVFAAIPAFAQSDEPFACDPYPNVPINITPVFDEPRTDTTLALAALQGLATSEPTKVIPHAESVTLGLTHYEPVIHFRVPMLKTTMDDGTTCVQVRQIDATIGYKNVMIYIAQELAANGCAMRHVNEHEKKHVAVNRGILVTYVPKVQAKLADYLKIYGVYRGPNAEYAESLMNDKVEFVLKETAQQIMEENRRQQKRIDSPEEYARNNFVCDGAIPLLIARSRQSR